MTDTNKCKSGHKTPFIIKTNGHIRQRFCPRCKEEIEIYVPAYTSEEMSWDERI